MDVEEYARSRGYKDAVTFERELKNEATSKAYAAVVLGIAGAMVTTSPSIGTDGSTSTLPDIDDGVKVSNLIENEVTSGSDLNEVRIINKK